MKRQPQLTDTAKLTHYSNEHVYYEVSMVIWTSELLAIPFSAPTAQLATVLRCAVIESFATHVRNLVDFFYSRKTVQPTDVIAADYYPGRMLPSHFPKISAVLDRARNRADKELAHLTVSRISGSPPEKEWPVPQIVHDLRLLLHRFVGEAQCVGPVLKAFVNSL